MFEANLFQGQRVLITGGGTGLGLAMAAKLAELGAELHLCGRRRSMVQQACEMLNNDTGAQAFAHELDIRQPEAVHTVIDRIWAEHGPLTGLVNNAAGNFVSRTEDLSMRAFDAVANIVMRGSFNLTLECGRRWLAEGRKASVLSILTTWVWNGSAFTVPSAMAKSGVHAMTQSLAVEWGNRGIRFNAIAPGLFPTEGMSARLNPQGGEHVRADNPMGRNGRMPELANLAVFLMSTQAEYLTGQTIAIDGGQYQATGGNFAGLASWSDQDWANARSAIESRNAADRQQRTA